MLNALQDARGQHKPAFKIGDRVVYRRGPYTVTGRTLAKWTGRGHRYDLRSDAGVEKRDVDEGQMRLLASAA